MGELRYSVISRRLFFTGFRPQLREYHYDQALLLSLCTLCALDHLCIRCTTLTPSLLSPCHRSWFASIHSWPWVCYLIVFHFVTNDVLKIRASQATIHMTVAYFNAPTLMENCDAKTAQSESIPNLFWNILTGHESATIFPPFLHLWESKQIGGTTKCFVQGNSE